MLEYHEVDYTQLGHQLAGKPRQQFQIFAHLRGQADERVISSSFERRQPARRHAGVNSTQGLDNGNSVFGA